MSTAFTVSLILKGTSQRREFSKSLPGSTKETSYKGKSMGKGYTDSTTTSYTKGIITRG